VVALVTAVCLGFAATLTVNSDMLALMPADDPAIANLRALQEEEGGVNLVSIAVTGEPEATRPFMLELEQRLNDDPLVDYALYDIDDELAWRLGLIHMETSELTAIHDRLAGALALGPQISNPFIAAKLFDLGPLTEKLSQADARGGVMSAQGDSSVSMDRLVLRPAGPANDLPFARELMKGIYDLLDELDPESHGVEVAFISGAYKVNVEDFEGIVSDMRWTAIASLMLVLTLLLVALRDARALFMIFVPLLVGTAWTFGFAGMTLGVLNTFTSVFGAVLVGLGIDFAIHLYTRYREERAHSDDIETAVIRAWDRAGPPCLAAAVTSAGGFCALLLARFDGFSELGMLLAFGVLACLISVFTLMPLLIRWRERQPRAWKNADINIPGTPGPPTYRLAPVCLLGLVLITVVMCFTMVRKSNFEYDLSELRRDGLAFDDLSVEEKALTKLSYAAIIASYPSEEELQADHVRLQAEIASGRLDRVDRVVSLQSVIPLDQDDNLSELATIRELKADENYVYLPASVRENLERIHTTPLEPLTPEDLPRGLRHLIGADGDHHRLLLFASGNVWDLREVSALKAQVMDAVDVPVAGEYIGLGSLYDVIRRDAPVVGLGAAVLVLLGTLLDLRKPLRAVGAMLVLAMGMVWAGGAVAMAGVKLSIVNIVGIPILLGIGVDVVIHLLHRLAEEGPGKVMKALTTTGWAAGLSAATTVLSFASLAVATNRGIRSLGMLVLVGLTSVTLFAFLMVPTGWMTAWKIRGDLPRD
jgi:uncharacterized protein